MTHASEIDKLFEGEVALNRSRESVFPHRPTVMRRAGSGFTADSAPVARHRASKGSPTPHPEPEETRREGKAGRGRRVRGRSRAKPSTRKHVPKLLTRLIALTVFLIIAWNVFGDLLTPRHLAQLKAFVEQLISTGERAVSGAQSRRETNSGPGQSPEGTAWRAHFERAQAAVNNGQHDDAERHFLNALFAVEKPGVDAYAQATVLDHVGYFYDRRGRHAEAIPHYLKALEGYRRTLGRDHEHFVSLARRTAYAYRAEHAYAEALAHLDEAIAAARELHGPNHAGIAYGYKETGDIRLMAGDDQAARRDYLRALEVAGRSLGANHALTVSLREAIATTAGAN